MKYLLTGVAALTLLTACGDKNKDQDGAGQAGIEYSQDKSKKIKLRKGDPATAGQVLSAMSLTQSGAGRVSFASSDVNGAKAVFKDVTLLSSEDDSVDGASLDDDDGELHLKGADLKAGTMTFDGLGMIDGNTRLIPGHGELAGRAELAAYRDMLTTVRDRVARLIREGRSQDQAVAANPTASFDSDWETSEAGTERFVRLVYRSLTEGR